MEEAGTAVIAVAATKVLLSDPTTGTKARASSILQRNVKVYGPSNALQQDSSSWNSEGLADNDKENHWFRLDFGRTVQPTSLTLQFQAGFVAQEGRIEYCHSTAAGGAMEWKESQAGFVAEWEDSHEQQTVALDNLPPCTSLRLILQDCTDFYGRIILYHIQVHGFEIAKD